MVGVYKVDMLHTKKHNVSNMSWKKTRDISGDHLEDRVCQIKFIVFQQLRVQLHYEGNIYVLVQFLVYHLLFRH